MATKKAKAVELERFPSTTRTENFADLETGQWFWVTDDDGDRWFGCVTHVGSNYVRMQGPPWNDTRIHFDEFDKRCAREADPEAVIATRIDKERKVIAGLMDKVKQLTAKLAITPKGELQDGQPSSETQALATTMGDKSYKTYKKDLIRAKEKTLPELFRKLEDANKRLARWMSAQILPLKAEASQLSGVLDTLKERVFHVELYAGLIEEVVQVTDGAPAGADEQIHLMQRRHYMDEECLVKYEHGGMEFDDIGAFDKWLARKDNFDRILPHPRCVVAFQVRRKTKHREGVTLSDFIRISYQIEEDKSTFIYLRNGEQLFRLSTGIDFGARLFPDLDKAQLGGEKLWAKMFANSVSEIITDGHYQEIKSDTFYNYEPFDPSSVHYDDIKDKIESDIKDHNRLVLVLQGLLDRSPVFHPHPPWQLWTADGFKAALLLVYDDSRALAPAERPDFEAYRKECNKTLKVGCVTLGQEDAWELHEGEKESRRRDRSYHYTDRDYRPERFIPHGNPGPGRLARPVRKRGRSYTFEWMRERSWQSERRNRYWGGATGSIKTTFAVHESKLLNVDAYKPGDFHKFFDDPRTRADYLKWAPLLLAAEDYYAGRWKVRENDE